MKKRNFKHIGVLGGGQLGMFLCKAAKKEKIKISVFSEDNDCCAKNFADNFFHGSFSKLDSMNNFINSVDLVTVETENIPLGVLKYVENKKKMIPNSKVIGISQNRLKEKNFINKLDQIKTAKFMPVNSLEDIKTAIVKFNGRTLVKSCESGYDGKNQYFINKDNLSCYKDFNFKDFIAEEVIKFKKEFSIIVFRDKKNNVGFYPTVQNIHRNNILYKSIFPSEISKKTEERVRNFSRFLAKSIDLEGILAIEMFLLNDDKILVNEIAPRPHNSGHWTMDGCNVSQFDNLVKILVGNEITEPKILGDCVMTNVIGEEYKKIDVLKKDLKFYDYFKKKITPKRKMGHFIKVKK